jgi:hypothetical protein
MFGPLLSHRFSFRSPGRFHGTIEAWRLETHTGPVIADPIRRLDYLRLDYLNMFNLLPSGAAVPGRLTKPMASVSVLLSSWALSCPPSLDNAGQGPGECQALGLSQTKASVVWHIYKPRCSSQNYRGRAETTIGVAVNSTSPIMWPPITTSTDDALAKVVCLCTRVFL